MEGVRRQKEGRIACTVRDMKNGVPRGKELSKRKAKEGEERLCVGDRVNDDEWILLGKRQQRPMSACLRVRVCLLT